MKSTRTFYKTVFHYEVLSEIPLGGMSMSQVLAECDTGGFSGRQLDSQETKLSGPEAATALSAQGSDPGFFQLTDKGEDESCDAESD